MNVEKDRKSMYRYLRVRIRGLVVSVLAFYSDYSSSNPAKVKNVVRLERKKQKTGRGWPIKKRTIGKVSRPPDLEKKNGADVIKYV